MKYLYFTIKDVTSQISDQLKLNSPIKITKSAMKWDCKNLLGYKFCAMPICLLHGSPTVHKRFIVCGVVYYGGKSSIRPHIPQQPRLTVFFFHLLPRLAHTYGHSEAQLQKFFLLLWHYSSLKKIPFTIVFERVDTNTLKINIYIYKEVAIYF